MPNKQYVPPTFIFSKFDQGYFRHFQADNVDLATNGRTSSKEIVDQILIASSKAHNLMTSAGDVNSKIIKLNESSEWQNGTAVKEEYLDDLKFFENSTQYLLDEIKAFRIAMFATPGGDPRVNIDSAIATLEILISSLSKITTKLENATSQDEVRAAIAGQDSLYNTLHEAGSSLSSVTLDFHYAVSELRRTTPTFLKFFTTPAA